MAEVWDPASLAEWADLSPFAEQLVPDRRGTCVLLHQPLGREDAKLQVALPNQWTSSAPITRPGKRNAGVRM